MAAHPPAEDDPSRRRSANRRTLLVTAAIAAVLILAWLTARRGDAPGGRARVVTLYAFSAMEAVMKERLLPAFRANWLEEHGEPVEIAATFAGSGAVTDRILAKVPAELAVLSSEIDAHRLGYRGVRWGAWRELPHGGVVSRSPLVILVRAGNPKGIRDFADLGRNDVEVVLADPTTSGVANWAILAVYGAALRRTGDPAAAEAELLRVSRRGVVRAPSAHEALIRFAAGDGDALLTYEAEALAGSPPGEVIYPPSTILSEHVVTRVDRNVEAAQRPVLDALLTFLWSDEAQGMLVDHGFRSIDDEITATNAKLVPVDGLFTLADLGGAAAARREILQGVWRDRIETRPDR